MKKFAILLAILCAFQFTAGVSVFAEEADTNATEVGTSSDAKVETAEDDGVNVTVVGDEEETEEKQTTQGAGAGKEQVGMGGGTGQEYAGVDFDELYGEKEEVTFQAASSMSFPDITDSKLKVKAELLKVLGIMQGYEDGTFKPDGNITRLEMAIVILNSLNVDALAMASDMNGSIYYDVATDHYGYPYIAAATTMGMINGYPDNTFKPDKTVSYEESVIMLMRALGYSSLVNASGMGNSGYYTYATEAGLLSGINVKDSSAITRAEAASLVFNFLKAPVLKQVTFGDDIGFDKTKNETVLAVYHDVYKGRGTVSATEVTAADGKTVGKGQIKIDSTVYKVETEDFNGLIGYYVDYYYMVDDDISTVVYMSKYNEIKEKTITSDDFIAYAGGEVKYFEEESRKTLSLDSYCDVIYNGKYTALKSLDEAFNIGEGMITFLSNDGDNVYETVIIDAYENVVLKVASSDGEIMFLTPEYDLQALEKEIATDDMYLDIIGSDGAKVNYSVTVEGVFDHDGNPVKSVDLSSIPAGSVVSYFTDKYIVQRGYKVPDNKTDYVKAMISTKTVVGTVESYDFGERIIIIDGVEYDIAKSNFFNEASSKITIGSYGTFRLDVLGKVVAYTEEVSDDAIAYDYGYLINAVTVGSIGGNLQMKVLTTDNKVNTYDASQSFFVNEKKMTPQQALSQLKASAEMLNWQNEDYIEAEKTSFTISQVIKFKLNADGYVTHIQTVTAPFGVADGYDKDTQLSRVAVDTGEGAPGNAQYRAVSDTSYRPTLNSTAVGAGLVSPFQTPVIYFVVPAEETFVDENYVAQSASNVGGLSGAQLDIFDVNIYKKPQVAVRYAATTNEDTFTLSRQNSNTPLMIKKISKGMNEDGFPVSKITVVSGLSEHEFEGETLGMFDGYKVGDVVTLRGVNEEIVTGISRSSWGKYNISPRDLPESLDSFGFATAENGTVSLAGKESGMHSTAYYGEVYIVDGTNFIVQTGKVVDETTGEREFQFATQYTTNTAYMMGGSFVFDNTKSGTNPRVGLGTVADLKSVYKDGAENASKVLIEMSHGIPRKIMIFNIDRENLKLQK